MEKDVFINRKNQLIQAREQAVGNVNYINGAIQECDHWIKELSKDQTKEVQDGHQKAA